VDSSRQLVVGLVERQLDLQGDPAFTTDNMKTYVDFTGKSGMYAGRRRVVGAG
jgi:hypothetical protein